MHNPESLMENETHKHFLEIKTETDPLISARQHNLVIAKKKKKKER